MNLPGAAQILTDRRSVLTMLGASALLWLPELGYAGAQIEEPWPMRCAMR